MKKKCPTTGEFFECGADTADPKNHAAFCCWCQEFPVVPSSGRECLGPTALAAIAEQMSAAKPQPRGQQSDR
ncbi:MAG TPA: hypothetical protein EYQ63_33440 [Fuerstia sp.]|nr:hypothetical protein [Fuerstiella sp.]